MVIATKQKISELHGSPFLVDTGDAEVDKMLKGYVRIVTGYNETMIYPVKS